MAKIIKQIIWPEGTNGGSVIDINQRIYWLGIQGFPGMSIKLKGAGEIQLNNTGVYELNPSNDIKINGLTMDLSPYIKPDGSIRNRVVIDCIVEGE